MRVSVEDMLKEKIAQNNNVTYFKLKNSNDSAIVRFLHKDINDFDVIDVHEIPFEGRTAKVNCLRKSGEDKSGCALCQANTYNEEKKSYKYPIRRKFYIHMLVYTDKNTCEEVVWERSQAYITTLKQLAEEYGDLYKRLFKIVRHGAQGSVETTYTILPLEKDVYVPSEYAFDEKQLEFIPAIQNVVVNKTNAQLKEFIETGVLFPKKQDKKEEQVVEVTPREEVAKEDTTSTDILDDMLEQI